LSKIVAIQIITKEEREENSIALEQISIASNFAIDKISA
jgi:hypothetical protein